MKINKRVKQPSVQIYYPEEIPDTSTQEVERIAKELKTRENEERIEDIKKLHSIKEQRIQITKENKFSHAINTIIEWLKAGKRIIPYLYFNFHHEEQQEFALFLDKLKEAKCFSSWTVNPYKDAYHLEIIFSETNLNKLINYRNQLVNGANTQKKKWTKKALEKELKRIKTIIKLGTKELNLLVILFDLDPHKLVKLRGSGSVGALKQLKSTVNSKIAKTGWVINHEGNDFNSTSCYRLEFLTR